MTPDEEKIVLLIVILIVALVTIYIELRIRKMGIGKKVVSSRVMKDQAYNALHTTKAVRNKLRMDQVNTMKADYIIQKAETAFEDSDYESCTKACRQAREELLRSKREGGMSAEAESPVAAIAAKVEAEGARQAEAPRIQAAGVDNSALLQAKFELKAAKADLEAFSGDEGLRKRASQLVEEAEKQLNTPDYQRSLSASFRARKLLSGEPLEEKAASSAPEPAKEPEELTKETEEGECGSCGAPLEPDDIFCHACGAPVNPGECSYCGAEMKGNEKFCRKCGKPAQR